MRFFSWLSVLVLPFFAPAPVFSEAPGLEPVLVFQRTACEGTCPVYTATVFADGRVAYVGEYAVPVLGQRTLHLPATQVAALLAEARRIHFEQFKEQYRGTITDLPGTVVTVRQPGQAAKTVAVEEALPLPKPLQTFLTQVGRCLDPLAGLK